MTWEGAEKLCKKYIDKHETPFQHKNWPILLDEEYQTKIPFDSVVASGIFALRVTDQKNYFLRQLQRAYSLAREILMVNILTTETPKKEQFDCFYYYDPVDLLLLKKLTPSPQCINIIDGYLKGDATIVVKR